MNEALKTDGQSDRQTEYEQTIANVKLPTREMHIQHIFDVFQILLTHRNFITTIQDLSKNRKSDKEKSCQIHMRTI